jgi:GntR family transcriptional regulator of vanillate catabolism
MSPARKSADHSSALPAPEEGSSQVVKAQLKLREMILAGLLPAGRRIAELVLVERLGVSRTPIRAALMRLEQEGLLQALPNGGYAVRTFSERDVSDAIELRGTVEGLAARMAAEHGAPAALLATARAGLEQIDRLLARAVLNDEAFSAYVELNRQFHCQLGQLAGSAVMQRELERIASMPFASPSAFVLVQADSPRARDMLVVAQDQHWQVLDAIERRESGRADAIMREHSRLACRNLHEAVHSAVPPVMPGVRLIRQRS